MLFAPKKINVVGIDISETSIKVMQLSGHPDSYFPMAYSNIDIPSTLIQNHMISDEEKLADNISKAVREAKRVNTKYVVASVPEAKSFVRILKMPKLPETELEGAIPWELEQDIPVPIDQVYMDWQIVKEDTDFNQVLVMATPKDYVDALVASIKLAKLKPVALELESQATARALIGLEDFNKATLIIDMSAAITSFIIVSGKGALEYTSSIPTGGTHVTESIAKNLGITPKEAEKMKIDIGLLADTKKGNIRQAMLPILDMIVDETRNVINFHKDHSKISPSVNKVILGGGAANLKGVVDYISARLNTGAGAPIDRIVLGDAWTNVMPKNQRIKIQIPTEAAVTYSTAIGLALRGGTV